VGVARLRDDAMREEPATAQKEQDFTTHWNSVGERSHDQFIVGPQGWQHATAPGTHPDAATST
jgi:hypothetical protein